MRAGILVWTLAAAALLSGSSRAGEWKEFKVKREAVFEFSEKPRAARENSKIVITFTSKGLCDATVAIEDSTGRIVRHLASGVLGPNAPAPFQKDSRRQRLLWDGKEPLPVKGLTVDPVVLRTHLRERIHHTLEHPVYSAIFGERKLSDTFGSIVREILDVFGERGLPGDLPEVVWARTLLDLVDRVRAGEKVDPPGAITHTPFDEAELGACGKMIFGRRSYRHWNGRPVPRATVEKVLEAGLWAANGCNMQSCRFIVMEDPEVLHKFANTEQAHRRSRLRPEGRVPGGRSQPATNQ